MGMYLDDLSVESLIELPSYDFDQNEQVLCMESVSLESPSTADGLRDFIAVGTGFDFAEDRASRGNVSGAVSRMPYLICD